MRKPINIFFTVYLVLSSLLVVAQDARFTQYYASELYLSPCFAAKESHPTIAGITRTQYMGISNPLQSNQVSLIYPIWAKAKRTTSNIAGVGVSFYNDQGGAIGYKNSGAYVNLAYNLRLTDDELNNLYFGLQAGFIQNTVSIGSIQTGNQYNPGSGFDGNLDAGYSVIGESKGDVDFGGGISYYFNHDKNPNVSDFSFNIGIAARHLNQPMVSLFGTERVLPRTIQAFGELTVHLGTRLYVSPQTLYKIQGTSNSINAGFYASYIVLDKHTVIVPNTLRIGGWYNFDESISPFFGFANELYSFGFSYDVANSLIAEAFNPGATYEISLSVQFYKVDQSKSVATAPRYQSLTD